MSNQHGFTLGKSCDFALSSSVDYIESAIHKRGFCIGIFLDIQGAFDNLPFDVIMTQLRHRGIDDELINWYDHLLQNRNITATLNGLEASRRPVKGTPQGGVLSADIWNISNQPLLDLFAGKRDTKAIGFADDTLLLLKGKNLNHLIKRAQTNLNKALRWGNSVGLTFNPLKTAIIN